MPTITLELGGARFHAAPADTVLAAALRAGLTWPYECSTGSCGTCKFELVSGSVDCMREAAPGLSERDRRKNRHLACQSRVTSDSVAKVRLDPEQPLLVRPERRLARLVARRNITHDIAEFHFVLAGGRGPADFRAGQYALVMLPGVEGARAYSMSNLPNADNCWQFQVRRVAGGSGSAALFDLPVGNELALDGPFGHAWLREESPRDIVCIAGGSGVAPMLSIARGKAVSTQLALRRLHFFYGGRRVADIPGHGAPLDPTAFDATCSYHAVVSEPVAGDGWLGETGWVHEVAAKRLDGPLDKYEYYIAGPPPMISATIELLKGQHGVDSSQIHFDSFL